MPTAGEGGSELGGKGGPAGVEPMLGADGGRRKGACPALLPVCTGTGQPGLASARRRGLGCSQREPILAFCDPESVVVTNDSHWH